MKRSSPDMFLILIALITFGTAACPVHAQQGQAVVDEDSLKVIKSTVSSVTIIEGDERSRTTWNLAPELKPDVYNAGLVNGKPQKVTFLSDVDSISILVEKGKSYEFIIDWNGKPCYQKVVGHLFVPAAVFDEEYIEEHKGKMRVQVPEVYELVNVAMAITSFGRAHKNYIYHNSVYYQDVQDWFLDYREHPFVRKLDSILSNNAGYYASLKMNGYSFVYNEDGTIERSRVFDRTGFGYQRVNTLLGIAGQ